MSPDEVPHGPLCVDTDVFSYLHLGKGPLLEEFRALIQGHLLVASFATVGELRALPHLANWGERRRDELEQKLRDHYLVLTPTDRVVAKYAELHARFSGRLSKGGQNDMWTAACALTQHRAVPVVTNNLGDFGTIAGEFPLTIIHPDI